MGMGRKNYGRIEDIQGKLSARQVRITRDGYESGSPHTYWGTGPKLFRVEDESGNFDHYLRAPSRKKALEKVKREHRRWVYMKRRVGAKDRYARYLQKDGASFDYEQAYQEARGGPYGQLGSLAIYRRHAIARRKKKTQTRRRR